MVYIFLTFVLLLRILFFFYFFTNWGLNPGPCAYSSKVLPSRFIFKSRHFCKRMWKGICSCHAFLFLWVQSERTFRWDFPVMFPAPSASAFMSSTGMWSCLTLREPTRALHAFTLLTPLYSPVHCGLIRREKCLWGCSNLSLWRFPAVMHWGMKSGTKQNNKLSRPQVIGNINLYFSIWFWFWLVFLLWHLLPYNLHSWSLQYGITL